MGQRYFCVGWVSAAHGLNGDLKIRLFSKKVDWLKKNQTFAFKKIKASPGLTDESIDVVIVSTLVRIVPTGILVQFESIKNRDQAEEIIGHAVFIAEKSLISEENEEPYLYEFLNSEVFLSDGSEIGRVKGVSSNGAQDLLVIETSTETFELPFVVPLIVDANAKTKRIVVAIPPGLRELFRK